MSEHHTDSTRRIRRVLSTRQGGHSAAPYDTFNLGDHVGDDPGAVSRNRGRLADAIGLGADRLVWMEQVHGRDVQVVQRPSAEPVEMTDGLVTSTPGLALSILSADCVPLLLWDAAAGVVGVAHAGRQGVRLGVAGVTVGRMIELGAQPDHIEALLGPAICGACYEVPAEMQADVEQVAPGSASRTRQGTAGLDLRAGLAAQLQEVGVHRLQVDPRCTAEDATLFSYRRDGRTGRQVAVIWIEED